VNVSVSRTGVVTFRTGGVELADLAWHDRRGSLQGTEWEAKSFVSVALSRDGRQILANFPDQGVERHVWLYDRQAAAAQQITSSGDTITLVFSQDGKSAVLGMHSGGTSGLWRTRLGSGAVPEQLVTEGPAALAFAADWHGPDVVYSTSVERAGRFVRTLYARNLETGADRALVEAPGNQMFGTISPDGRRLAYSSDASGDWEVYVASLASAGERWRVSTAGGHQPRWSPDGSELYYIAPDRRLMAVRVRGGSGGFQWDAPRPLFQTALADLGPFRGCWGYAVAPDNQHFLILSRRPQGPSPAIAIVNWRFDAATSPRP
jgi:Tol biopolymer transport system component